jgi:hypothetical protein
MRFRRFLGGDESAAMRDWFVERTRTHIDAVQRYAAVLDQAVPGLAERTRTHDLSKFEAPERDPYILITWRYKCRAEGRPFEVTAEQEDAMHEATVHHVRTNRHHPEFHDPSSSINRHDRDRPPDRPVDGTGMSDVDVAEMVADWLAVGAELGTSAREWADKNIGSRWLFTDRQESLIYDLLALGMSE